MQKKKKTQKKTTIPFKMPSKIPKNKLNQDIKTLKPWSNNWKKIQRIQKISHDLRSEHLNMSTLPKDINIFNAMLIKKNLLHFHRTRTNISKIYMELQKDPELPKQSWVKEQSLRHNPPRLQAILGNYSHQSNLILEQKQTYVSMAE